MPFSRRFLHVGRDLLPIPVAISSLAQRNATCGPLDLNTAKRLSIAHGVIFATIVLSLLMLLSPNLSATQNEWSSAGSTTALR